MLSKIPVVHDLPGVGQNYVDHAAFGVTAGIENTDVIRNGVTLEELEDPKTLLKWLVSGSGN